VSHEELDQKAAIVLAGVKRLGSLEGFPVTDFALVGETDLDLDEVRACLLQQGSNSSLQVAPGEQDGSVQVIGVPGERLPDLGESAEG
jgi:hypothetical protein